MRRTIAWLALLSAAGALPARAQDLSVDLRRDLPRPEPSNVLRLLRQEDEKPVPRDPAPLLEPVPPTRRGMSNVGYGPLRLTSQAPLQALRLGISAEVPSSLAPGQWETRESLTWSRMWAQADDYLLSFETLGRSCSVSHGVTERIQVELGAAETARFAGELEGFVKDFHDVFDLQQGGRDTVVEGAYRFQLDGQDLGTGSPHDSVDHLFASLHYTVTEGSEKAPAVAASLTIGRGLGKSLDLRGESVAVAGSLSAAKSWGDVYGYLGLGAAWYGRESFHGLPLKPFGASILAGLEWRILPGVSLLLQQLWTPGALKGYEELSKPAYELGFGLKLEADAGAVVEIGITENVLVFDSSPDFGIHAGLSLRF